MTKRTMGIIAGVIGVGAWWYRRQRSSFGANRTLTPSRERGTVIFDNTPTPVVDDAIV